MIIGGFQIEFYKKIVIGPINQQKTGKKSYQIRIDYCWFCLMFEGFTNTCLSAIGYFLIFWAKGKQKKKAFFLKNSKPTLAIIML